MDPTLAQQLLDWQQRDLDYRQQLLERGDLYQGYDPQMESIHLENANHLKHVIDQHGWPGISLVGEKASRAAWMIAQHAISHPRLQRLFAQALTQAVDRGQARPLQLAYLEDRIRFNEGSPQRYGLIFDWQSDATLGVDVDDETQANQRRKELGLPDLQQAINDENQAFKAEGGVPPRNLELHRQQGTKWAIRVGWRTARD